jgi:hypothetical protein
MMANDSTRKKWSARRVLTACYLSVLAVALCCHRLEGPFFYSTEPIHGRVIDEETAKPLPDVVVVAIWLTGGFEQRVLRVMETKTAANGEYSFPPTHWMFRRPLTWLTYEDPELGFYKPGYAGKTLTNHDSYIFPISPAGTYADGTTLADGRIVSNRGYSRSSTRFSYWNGKTIPLQPAHTADEEYKALNNAESIAGLTRLKPTRLPLLWTALAAGYRNLPADLAEKTGFGDPQHDIDYWREKDK